MQTDPNEVQRRLERFETLCRREGIKLTHQRLQIFREVARAGDHPDADTIFRRVRAEMPTLSLDTVYRTLWVLNDLGLVTRLGPSRERTRFDANLDRHHHFVCVRCGSTRDFYSQELDQLGLPESAQALGRVETTHVEVRGVCLECAAGQGAPGSVRKGG